MIDYQRKIEDIERELKIMQAIWDGRISFESDEEDDMICRVGECWIHFFYLYEGKIPANKITPNNINTHIPIMELAEMIKNAIVEQKEAEYEYCCDILNW